jgi:predicted CoA-binding protein
MDKVLILGASANPTRFSHKAIKSLLRRNYNVVAIGLAHDTVDSVTIETDMLPFTGIDTILVYLSAENQVEYYNYMLSLNPRRIIMNPGANNPEFEEMAKKKGISVVNDCGLVMINTNKF